MQTEKRSTTTDITPVKCAIAVMTEEIGIEDDQGWTYSAVRREVERRKAVHEMLGGSMDIFETTEVDDLELITL